MVNITIFIEGGIVPHSNDSVATIDNSEKLRESFYVLLSQLLPENKFNITVRNGAGFPQTIKIFKGKVAKNPNTILLIDLDTFKNNKREKIEILALEEYDENVFFMVQEMEAWIISQIDKIDKLYENRFHRKKLGQKLSDDEKINTILPEDIEKPSKVLKVILGRYFSYRNNKKKNKKYGKMKDGAELLSILNAEELQLVFSDFDDLIYMIKNDTTQ